jgi:hypothetical protein
MDNIDADSATLLNIANMSTVQHDRGHGLAKIYSWKKIYVDT